MSAEPESQLLQRRTSELQERWIELNKKLARLKRTYFLETRPEEKLRLRFLIVKTQSERGRVEHDLDACESELASALSATHQDHDLAEKKPSFEDTNRTRSIKKLDWPITQEIVNLLAPFMQGASERHAMLTLALGHSPILHRLDFSGAVEPFVLNMISALAAYGEVEPGKQALWALLEVVRDRVGLDRQVRIDALYPVVNAIDQDIDQTLVESPTPSDSASIYYRLAKIAEQKGNYTVAKSYYQKSLEIDEKNNNEHGAASTLAALGELLQSTGDPENAQIYLQRALILRERILGLDDPDTIHVRDLLQLREQALARKSFTQTVPWGEKLLNRLEKDGASLTHIRWANDNSNDSCFLQIHLPEILQNAYGLAPEALLLAVRDEVQSQHLQTAREVIYTQHFRFDFDLLIVVDNKPNLAERLDRMFQVWGQWIPWSLRDGDFPPLKTQFHQHLQSFDIFEQRDPVRGRQVIGRKRTVEDLTKRLQRGQAVGIFGLRKIGKTTVVRAVTDELDPDSLRFSLPGSNYLVNDLNKARLLVVWLDVQNVWERRLDCLLQCLQKELERRFAFERIPLPQPDAAATPLDRLSTALETALQLTSLPLCIVLDEYDLLFEGYDGQPAIQGIEKLFRLFRGLAQQTGKLSLVVIGRDPDFLQRPEMGGHANPMLNWFIPYWLGPFEPTDADELLSRLGRRVLLNVGVETRKTALRWTGGHPLLHRQYGSALLTLARTRQPEALLIPTDAFHQQAVDIFLKRDSVITQCREIFHLLDARYPQAADLLRKLCQEPERDLPEIIQNHGGWYKPAIRILQNFGLVLESRQSPCIPEVLRWYVHVIAPDRTLMA